MISDLHRGHQQTKNASAPSNDITNRNISEPSNPRPLGKTIVKDKDRESPLGAAPIADRPGAVTPAGHSPAPLNRTIRFPDENPSVANLS